MSKSMSVGTTLKVNNKVVGGLKSIGGIEITADTHDVTALNSTGGYREFLSGFKDGGGSRDGFSSLRRSRQSPSSVLISARISSANTSRAAMDAAMHSAANSRIARCSPPVVRTTALRPRIAEMT